MIYKIVVFSIFSHTNNLNKTGTQWCGILGVRKEDYSTHEGVAPELFIEFQ